MELLLIRHGLPVRTVGRGGAPADPPLSPEGQAQAVRMARWLASEPIDHIVASPLRRAHETALPLADDLGLEISLEEGIAEFDRDANEYIPMEELKRDDPAEWRRVLDVVYKQEVDLEAFRDRIVDGLERVIAENPGRRVAVVCHAGVINVWTAHLLGLEPQLFFDPGYTSINRYLAAGSGQRSLLRLNEVSHLDPRVERWST